jgi:hypothetical protein
MIKIESSGRMGNKLHHYAFARYVSQITNQTFVPERIEGFKHTYYNHEGSNDKDYNYIKTNQVDINSPDIFEVLKKHDGGIIVNGMLDRWFNFKHIEPFIKSYLEIENEENYPKPNKEDLVIHIRLGDYLSINWFTEKYLYLKAIEMEEHDKCYIVTDEPHNPWLKEFRDLGCIIRSDSMISDFVFIKHANKICISKSTYSWMSAIASDAEVVYFPLSDNKAPYLHNPTSQEVDLRPLDKKNWVII